MASYTPQIKKVPPCMNELLDIYNFSHSGINVVEKCIFGRLMEKEKVIGKENNKINSKLYLSPDGTVGCLFSTDENKLRIDTFENTCIENNMFLNCINSVRINDLHKKFLFSNHFCSFNSSNTLLVYCAVNDDIRIPKESQLTLKEYEMLKKLNDNVYTETFGEKNTYSFFYLYIYNYLNNTVKPIAVKDISSCYYNPQFIDETSFVCLSYQTDPFRLGIYAFNSRPNHLYLCTLNKNDIYSDIDTTNGTVKKRNDIRCACMKISTKQAKHTLSPIVIHDKEHKYVYIACLTVMSIADECWQHINECNLVLIKLAKENECRKTSASSESNFKNFQKVEKLHEVVKTSDTAHKNEKDVFGQEEKVEYSNNNIDNVYVDRHFNNQLQEDSNDIETWYGSINMAPCNSNNSSSINSTYDVKHEQKRNYTVNDYKESCAYKKVDTEILVRAGNHTELFRGIYTDEIKGCCFPYIFLNTIMYCNRICIGVHMFTKKIYRVLVGENLGVNYYEMSIQMLCMKESNMLMTIKNCVLNDLLYYCLFDESFISGECIYLKPIQSYSLDFSDFKKIIDQPKNISLHPDNREKMYLTLKEIEGHLFQNKHPFLRRKRHDFNLLFQQEEKYIEQNNKNPLFLPNFNLFNKQGLRNLILYLHGGPYAVSLNEFRSIFIFFIACGFDVICINYTGSLTFTSKKKILNGRINTVEICNIINVLKEFKSCFTDYENIYIYGGSYGGNLGCALLEKYNLFKGACLINGVFDWLMFTNSTDIPDYTYNFCLNKNFDFDYHLTDLDLKLMHESSPIHFVENIRSPILLVCSKNDLRVSYHNSLALYNKLRGCGKKCKLLLFEDDGHSIDNYRNEETMLINTILWFYGYDIKKKK